MSIDNFYKKYGAEKQLKVYKSLVNLKFLPFVLANKVKEQGIKINKEYRYQGSVDLKMNLYSTKKLRIKRSVFYDPSLDKFVDFEYIELPVDFEYNKKNGTTSEKHLRVEGPYKEILFDPHFAFKMFIILASESFTDKGIIWWKQYSLKKEKENGKEKK